MSSKSLLSERKWHAELGDHIFPSRYVLQLIQSLNAVVNVFLPVCFEAATVKFLLLSLLPLLFGPSRPAFSTHGGWTLLLVDGHVLVIGGVESNRPRYIGSRDGGTGVV